MTNELILSEASALDLEIAGSVGSFAVKPTSESDSSVQVRYIQTHVRFSLDGSHQQRLFENLVPVREIFDNKVLDFEDLMQRDIDDSRVSTSLIPYLISLQKGESVKFFPPIVTVVIPVTPDKQIQDHYPPVTEERVPVQGYQGYQKYVMRSGAPGNEAFQFEQLEVEGRPKEFDNARLRINTSKCRIVIVDGQHRAMALLALYRNIKGWPDKTAAVKDYYKIWSKNILRENLQEISLPIVVCAFPPLNQAEGRSITVTKACRTIFLALNKNARPVSTARNILLDDYDLIAHFERSVLESVKALDIHSPSSLRLWNFELDADENKVALNSTVALSGVMHVYSMLERVLLSNQAPVGLNYPPKKYGKIKHILDTCLRRLNGTNLLGEDQAKSTHRYAFTTEARDILRASFDQRYTKYILRGFQEFYPYEALARAAIKLEVEIRGKHDMQCHAMLFEGQGILRVFEDYLEHLSTDLAESYPDKNIPPENQEILNDFKATQKRLREYQKQFARERALALLASISPSKVVDEIQKSVDGLYKTVFNTTAFQNALFITFFSTVEAFNKDSRGGIMKGDDVDDSLFEGYMAGLNSFFQPKSEQEAKRLLSVFSGKVTGSFGTENMKIADTANNLRSIVFQNELKPDEWGKFRYFLLEIWRASAPERVEALLGEYVEVSRADVLRAFTKRRLTDYCLEKGIDFKDVDQATDRRIKKESLNIYVAALSDLIGDIPAEEKQKLEAVLENRPVVAEEEVAVPDEVADEE